MLNVVTRYVTELGRIGRPAPALMPTPYDVVATEGTARLLRFVGPRKGKPLLLVPSLINQWYVLDLRAGASLVAALVESGLDVWCLDWGAPEDEDRYRGWDGELGRQIRDGNTSLAELAGRVESGEISPTPTSGRQELFENVVNDALWHR